MTSAWVAIAVVSGALATALILPPRPRASGASTLAGHAPRPEGRSSPARAVLVAGAGLCGWAFVGGTWGFAVGPACAAASWWVLRGIEPSAVRREREAVAAELPHLVDLLASSLRAGGDPLSALGTVTDALPGAAGQRLAPALAHARLGGHADEVWATLADDSLLAPLGRALARSQTTGASVVDTVERLADELEMGASGAAEDRARRVGVLAALPLGLCLLPAFLLIGIVPVVAALLASITD